MEKYKIQNSKPFISLLIAFVICFAGFIYYFEKQTLIQEQSELDLSADVVADSVWTLFTPATSIYLDQIFRDRYYKKLTLKSLDSVVLIEMQTELSSPVERFMENLGLIHLHTIKSPVLYNGEVIGHISAEAYHLNMYIYVLIFVIAAIIFLALWFAMLVNKNNLDLAKRKLNEKHLKRLNETLQEKVQQEIDKNRKSEEIIHNQKKLTDMGQMINAISHQWRQPLTALGYNIQDISEAYKLGEANLEYMENFERESMTLVSYLSTTIDDFRLFYKPDKEVQNFNAIDEIVSMLRLTSAQLQNNGIKVNMDCDSCDSVSSGDHLFNVPSSGTDSTIIRGYQGEFKQVIFNLIYNSIDAIGENIKKNNISEGIINVNVTCLDDDVIIKISDNGGGIPEKIASNIFDPYFSTKEEGKGTGIGLYMSKTIIESHMNGSLNFENNEDGAVFTITIPINKANTPEA